MSWYIKVWKNCFDFKGRARRKEFWIFTLFNTFILLSFSIPIKIYESTNNLDDFPILILILYIIYIIYVLAATIPSLTVCVRRLHDTNRKGTFAYIMFIAISLGEIVVRPIGNANLDWGANTYAKILISGSIVFVLVYLPALLTLIVFLILNGTPGENRYGPDPKSPTKAPTIDTLEDAPSPVSPSSPLS